MIETRNIKFSKAQITRDEETGDFIVEEVKKEEIVVTNLTQKLCELIGVEGLEISISKKTEYASEE